ncbi:HAD family hydrolase [Actinoplanes flavus]|uniref:HAD family phosphatase n=1 Tax=Actinoplanes flavus TaxID=2820290 RepID=A0ABS3UTP2_9ACTN|nr:HAD family phosphatase [Actinoplanes flavus]MBO3741953.1 HAD family phosphatase [Actinoplanes flavus]
MPKKAYEAALFDMDGVVTDTERTVTAFWQDLATNHGFVISDEDLDEHVFGRHADHTLRILFPGIPHTGHVTVYERLRINDQTLRYTEIPGAVRLIGELRAAGIPIALVTGAQDWKAVAVLEQLGLTDSFDVQIRADDIPVGKPDPACYRLAAGRLGVDIERCVIFEDAFSGVTSAVTAGGTCVGIGPRRRESRLTAIGALTVIPDFRQSRYERENDRLHLDQDTVLPFTRVGATTR